MLFIWKTLWWLRYRLSRFFHPIFLQIVRDSTPPPASETQQLDVQRLISVEERETQPALLACAPECTTSCPDEPHLPERVGEVPPEDAFLLASAPAHEQRHLARYSSPFSPDQQMYLQTNDMQIVATQSKETIVTQFAIVSYTDETQALSFDRLCRKAIQKCARKNGVLPTHVVVNTLRLLSEWPADEWHRYLYKTRFYKQPVEIVLRGDERCPWHVARALIDRDEGTRASRNGARANIRRARGRLGATRLRPYE